MNCDIICEQVKSFHTSSTNYIYLSSNYSLRQKSYLLMMNMFSFTYFHLLCVKSDLYEKYVDKGISIKILLTNFRVLCFAVYAIPTYEHWN